MHVRIAAKVGVGSKHAVPSWGMDVLFHDNVKFVINLFLDHCYF